MVIDKTFEKGGGRTGVLENLEEMKAHKNERFKEEEWHLWKPREMVDNWSHGCAVRNSVDSKVILHMVKKDKQFRDAVLVLFQVADISGWTSASCVLEAGLGGDKLVFKVPWGFQCLLNTYFL